MVSLRPRTGPIGDARTGAPTTHKASGTRNPERPILFACAIVGLLFALLAVLERMGVERRILGALAVALPVLAVAALAVLGRTIDRLPFAVDGARGGSLANGLALGAEWMGVWIVPAIVLLPSGAVVAMASPTFAAALLGPALGIVVLTLGVAGAMRRAGALTAPAFLAWRTGSRVARLSLLPAALLATGGLVAFQTMLLHALLVPFVGGGAGTVLAIMTALAAIVCLVGGQRSLTLVNAFLAFFLALAVVVPALAAIAGMDGLTPALPLDRAFAGALPHAGGRAGLVDAMATLVALGLAVAALPVTIARLAPVRPGALDRAGAWTMLLAYVTVTAATLAFARAALAPGLAVAPSGETSILGVLPALGWLGAVWAGLAVSLFASAALLGGDLRWRAPYAPPWMDTAGLARMRLVFITVTIGAAVWTFAGSSERLAPWIGVDEAAFALKIAIVAGCGALAPALGAATFWRHPTWLGFAAGQAAFAAVVASGFAFDAVPLALVAAAANLVAIVVGSIVTPRRWRPSPAHVLALRDPR